VARGANAPAVAHDLIVQCTFSSTLPDHASISRHRNTLFFDKLFAEIMRQLEGKGRPVKESSGAILDVTIIESSR
jgi:hypothetical protein